MANLCFKDHSAYTWEEYSREGDKSQEDPGALHVRGVDGVSSRGNGGTGQERMEVRETGEYETQSLGQEAWGRTSFGFDFGHVKIIDFYHLLPRKVMCSFDLRCGIWGMAL